LQQQKKILLEASVGEAIPAAFQMVAYLCNEIGRKLSLEVVMEMSHRLFAIDPAHVRVSLAWM
jgi:hypothetical protein